MLPFQRVHAGSEKKELEAEQYPPHLPNLYVEFLITSTLEYNHAWR